jgi:putative hydrolase of the HAD superfamily
VRVREEEIAEAMAAIEPPIEQIHASGRDVSAEKRLQLLADALRPGLSQALPGDIWPLLIEVERETMLAHLPLVMDGAVDALTEARALGLRVALVSNTGPTPGVVLRDALQRLGLAGFFDAWIWSDEVGWWKPAPEIYRLATEALGVAPEQTVFVGDTPETDIVGALQAGMWAVQIGDREHDGVRPHARITGHAEFWDSLAALELVLRHA